MIVVVGGTGFLGSALLRELHRSGADIRSVSRAERSTGPWPHISADILNEAALTKALAGAEAVFHAAGLAHINSGRIASGRYDRINVDGTRNVARAAATNGARRIVLASSVAVYGTGIRGPISESTPSAPDSDYGRTKLLAEQALHSARGNAQSVVLRFAAMYGPGDPGNVTRLARLLQRRQFVWIGSGMNRKSLLHVEDAVRACRAALLDPVANPRQTFNLAGAAVPMREIVRVICAVSGIEPPRIRVPETIAGLALNALERGGRVNRRMSALAWTLRKWLSDDVIDSTAFSRAFGWRPEVTLEAGIAQLLADGFQHARE